MTFEYSSNIAKECSITCPPVEAVPTDLEVWRTVNSLPPKATDFLSDIETNKKCRDKANCLHWGCSIWPSEEAAIHARDLFGWVRAKFVVKVRLVPTDGQILSTPTRDQPEHSTFWKDTRVDLSTKSSVAFSPEKREQ